MGDSIIFEQPLNERVRSFLRLEHLFSNVDVRIHGQSEWDSRETLTNLIEVSDMLSRSDLKGELIKELERHASTLNNLKENPAVDHERLLTILQGINGLIEQLRSPHCQPGQAIRADDLVNSIKQRSTIPGGSCGFDLPAYHHWLNQPVEQRTMDLDRWYRDLRIIRDAVSYSLSMIRNSATPKTVVADNGLFQQSLESSSACQLIRVVLPATSPYFPEISGGRHRFTLRFMYRDDTQSRPLQADQDIEFELHCCIL
ncbi:MAG: cell division protein ZapD [Gammaproteobacteria bacterium]|nr:cell division protein ZapD [Gammaproteobacteria bacterium]